MRIITWLGVLLVTTATCVAADKPFDAAWGRPNIVIIMADDLGYGDINAGPFKGWIDTPHLDRMAAEGLSLTDYHSNGAVCSPTRAALMTGRYQQRASIPGVVYADPKRPQHKHGLQMVENTFAELLRGAGYATGMFGKWHLGYEKQYNPIHQGFDQYRGFVSGNVDYFTHVDQAGHFDWWIQDQLKQEEGYTTHLITRHGLRFIREHRDEPFCLYLSHEAPHYPFQGPNDPPVRTIDGEFKTHGDVDDPRRAYREMVAELDRGVGQVIDLLKELKLDKRTLVVFCSDNGAARHGSNKPLRGGKGSMWEGGHRVPAIAWWPGTIQSGSRSDQATMSMDLMPTMLELAGVDEPRDRPLDGVSLLPVLLGKGELEPRVLFWQYGNRAAMRDGRWKLITNERGVKGPALFDLSKDLGERNDLSDEHPRRVKSMQQALARWDRQVHAGATPQPTP